MSPTPTSTRSTPPNGLSSVSTAAVLRAAATVTPDRHEMTTPDGGVPDPASVGTTVWVYDPDQGLFDTANPIPWNGPTVYPVALRALGATWPVTAGMGVYVRHGEGWADRSPYLVPDSGAPTLEVGATRRTLINLTRQLEAFRSRVAQAG